MLIKLTDPVSPKLATIKLPPMVLPPMETPPMETPPGETPPEETPPEGTPPEGASPEGTPPMKPILKKHCTSPANGQTVRIGGWGHNGEA
ncbi:unnamed protein product [Lota lota]